MSVWISLPQGAIVDAHLVNPALEELAPEAVAADTQDTRGRRDGARDGHAGHLAAVDEEPERRPVIRPGHVNPRVDRKARAFRRPVRPTHEDVGFRAPLPVPRVQIVESTPEPSLIRMSWMPAVMVE